MRPDGRHLTEDELRGYAAKTLAASDLVAVLEHIAGCDACREALAARADAAARLTGARSLAFDDDAHPDVDELMAFADGALDHARMLALRTHVDACDVCAQDVADFAQLRMERTGASAAAASPAPSANASGSPAVARASSTPIWMRAAAAVLLVGVSGGIWWLSRSSDTAPAESVARGPESSAPADAPAPETARGVVLTDGVVSLLADGSVRGLERSDPGDRARVEAMFRDGRLPASPDDRGLRPPPSVLMGGDAPAAALKLVAPVGVVVEGDRPAFAWTAVPGATAYRVSVYDTQLALQLESGAVTATTWTPATPLRRGAVYLWQVEAETPAGVVRAPGPDAPEARFRVIKAEDAEALRALAAARPASRLTLAARYAALGLHQAAAREFEALAAANRGSALAASLARAARARETP